MTTTHDHELGAALRGLEVPQHGPEFEAELRRRLAQPPRRRRPWLVAVAAVLAVVVASVVVPRGSGVASAAQVREAIGNAFASAGTVSGIFVNREQPGGGASRWRFVLSSSGSFRITGLGRNNPTDVAYDAQGNVQYGSDLGLFTRYVGLAPGPPDSASSAWVVQRGLSSVIAALAASSGGRVEQIDYHGRPAWLLRTPSGNPGERLRITVDRETGIPVHYIRLRNGRFAGEWRIDELRVDAQAPAERFRLRPGKDQSRTSYDLGFQRVPLAEVSATVGYRPLVPGWLPSGFEQDEVAVANDSRPTGDEQHQNPLSREVASLHYRRGLDELTITTRLTGADPSAWGDPVTGSSVRAGEPERVSLGGGALRGKMGELVLDPNSVPHVWAIAGPLVVTIAGDLDRAELLRVAESLHAR